MLNLSRGLKISGATLLVAAMSALPRQEHTITEHMRMIMVIMAMIIDFAAHMVLTIMTIDTATPMAMPA